MRLHAASKETGIAGEQFAPLEVGQDKLSGVFVKDGTSLAFAVQRAPGGRADSMPRREGAVQPTSTVKLRLVWRFAARLNQSPCSIRIPNILAATIVIIAQRWCRA